MKRIELFLCSPANTLGWFNFFMVVLPHPSEGLVDLELITPNVSRSKSGVTYSRIWHLTPYLGVGYSISGVTNSIFRVGTFGKMRHWGCKKLGFLAKCPLWARNLAKLPNIAWRCPNTHFTGMHMLTSDNQMQLHSNCFILDHSFAITL